MPLESLFELVGTLRERIEEYSLLLGQNEMRTRYALIDPLLLELGWDTSNPSEVMIEDGSGDGRADYLLIDNNQPVMIIEAKRLGLGVSDGRQQAIRYAMDQGRRARYFAVTDGNQWEIYDTHQPAINMMLISFDLRETSSAEVCLKVLALWRSAVEHNSVMAAETPIVGLDDIPQPIAAATVVEKSTELQMQVVNDAHSPVPQVHPAISETTVPVSQIDKAVVGEWIPLPELSSPTDTTPAEITFSDGSNEITNSWAQLITDVTRWLYDNSYLSLSDMPIRLPRATKRYIISDSPFHIEGDPFSKQHKQVGPFYIETNVNSEQVVKNTCFIIERIGQDPSQFKVRLR